MILVTGATGIVGHFVVQTLISTGHKIRALKRANSDISRLANFQGSIEWVDSDLLDLTSLEKAFQGVDKVVHCAAKVSFHKEDKEEMLEVNVTGTANMVNLSIENGVKKFVHVSSVAALGRKPNNDLIDENTKWEVSDDNSNYAESKYLGELEVRRAQEEGLDSVIVNPSIVLGPGQWDSSSMQLFKYAKEERFFYPKGEMNYVDVRDVANIIEVLLFSDIKEERFILNSGKAYYKYVFQLIAADMKKRPPKIEVSYALLIFAYIIDTMKSKLLRSKSIITKESIRMSKMSYFFSNEKIVSTLNYEFKTLEESINWTCEEIEKQGL